MRAEVVARIYARQFLAEIPMNGPQIENSGGEVADLPLFGMRHVTRHGKRLEIDFGSHDGTTEAGDHSVLQALDFMSKNQEVAITGGTDRRSITVRMFMDDV